MRSKDVDDKPVSRHAWRRPGGSTKNSSGSTAGVAQTEKAKKAPERFDSVHNQPSDHLKSRLDSKIVDDVGVTLEKAGKIGSMELVKERLLLTNAAEGALITCTKASY